MDWITSILTLVAWLGVGVLLLVLYRIAHFYQATWANLPITNCFLSRWFCCSWAGYAMLSSAMWPGT